MIDSLFKFLKLHSVPFRFFVSALFQLMKVIFLVSINNNTAADVWNYGYARNIHLIAACLFTVITRQIWLVLCGQDCENDQQCDPIWEKAWLKSLSNETTSFTVFECQANSLLAILANAKSGVLDIIVSVITCKSNSTHLFHKPHYLSGCVVCYISITEILLIFIWILLYI